jgi:hypothetical protein
MHLHPGDIMGNISSCFVFMETDAFLVQCINVQNISGDTCVQHLDVKKNSRNCCPMHLHPGDIMGNMSYYFVLMETDKLAVQCIYVQNISGDTCVKHLDVKKNLRNCCPMHLHPGDIMANMSYYFVFMDTDEFRVKCFYFQNISGDTVVQHPEVKKKLMKLLSNAPTSRRYNGKHILLLCLHGHR